MVKYPLKGAALNCLHSTCTFLDTNCPMVSGTKVGAHTQLKSHSAEAQMPDCHLVALMRHSS